MADDATRQRRFEAEALSHLDALYRTALRLTRNSSDAEDPVPLPEGEGRGEG